MCSAQTKDELFSLIDKFTLDDNGNITFSFVESIPGKTKSQLHALANMYFVNSFKSANSVIQINDSASGILAGRGFFRGSYSVKIPMSKKTMPQPYIVYFLLKISSKHEKIKIDITKFEYSSNAPIVGDVSAGVEYYLDKKIYTQKTFIPSSYNILETIYLETFAMHKSIKGFMIAEEDDW
jgi:hypothetical protein